MQPPGGNNRGPGGKMMPGGPTGGQDQEQRLQNIERRLDEIMRHMERMMNDTERRQRTPEGARPGGTPFLLDGKLILPVQDCATTYGAAIHLLVFDALTPERADITPLARLTAPANAGAYRDGLHTLTSCGDVTLIDVKRVVRSLAGMLIDVRRKLAR